MKHTLDLLAGFTGARISRAEKIRLGRQQREERRLVLDTAVLETLKMAPSTTAAISEVLGLQFSTSQSHLYTMHSRGLVHRDKTSRTAQTILDDHRNRYPGKPVKGPTIWRISVTGEERLTEIKSMSEKQS